MTVTSPTVPLHSARICIHLAPRNAPSVGGRRVCTRGLDVQEPQAPHMTRAAHRCLPRVSHGVPASSRPAAVLKQSCALSRPLHCRSFSSPARQRFRLRLPLLWRKWPPNSEVRNEVRAEWHRSRALDAGESCAEWGDGLKYALFLIKPPQSAPGHACYILWSVSRLLSVERPRSGRECGRVAETRAAEVTVHDALDVGHVRRL